MFRIESEKDLLRAFRAKERKFVELPKDLKLPLFVRDYLAWGDPYGVRVFLLFTGPGSKHPTGIAFRRDQQGDPTQAPQLCEWCRSSYGADIGLLTTDVNSKRRVGLSLCLDLRCGERLESQSDLSGRSAQADKTRLLERMDRFARNALGITGPDPDA
jgi:hypothetical protein